ncbi:MAG TPA: hypothetical protein VFL31_06295, partial [Nitrospiraceae bacterium]|nr:hypothetical protein [Nitrospiraceae bacterium]
PLTTRIDTLRTEKNKLDQALDSNSPSSIPRLKSALEAQIADLRLKLDEPSRRYQDYLAALRLWEEARAAIVGDALTPRTVTYYQETLTQLTLLPSRLNTAYSHRASKAREIYSQIKSLANTYSRLYQPVQEFIDSHPLASTTLGFNFHVSIVDSGFANNFLDFINQATRGSFYGIEEGGRALKAILARHDFNLEDDAIAFTAEVMSHLTSDRRGNPAEPVRIADQLRMGRTLQRLYDFIFSFDYLVPRYVLKMGGKELPELSPGERGSLLLIFYLLVDKDDIPLAIDQPEENLDNQTVFQLLVPCIKEAKQRRQIFIVTHNPNLGVVCDAEQIIYAHHEKLPGDRINYISGAIENPTINKLIVDVLEGTRPAFDNRDSKYLAPPG